MRTVADKLKTKGVHPACSACQLDLGWQIGTPTGTTAHLVISDPAGGTHSIHVLPIICNNCGFVQLHDESVLFGDNA